jgi:mono/diheme cytochrome c family protein
MDRSVGVFDLRPLLQNGAVNVPLLANVNAVTTEKLTATVLKGKQFFYDARDTRLARDRYMSCATCHNDGGSDGRVWDLTGMGEGLRNTITLNGRGGMGHGFLHWSANFDEVQDFEGQIRSLAGGTGLMTDAAFATRSTPLGAAKAGASADLDALAAYLASLTTFSQSPYRDADGSLTAAAVQGRTVFQDKNCGSCHAGTNFTDSAAATLDNIGTIKQPTSGQRLGAALTGIDPPTLRDVWATAPYLHDGSARTLEDAVRAHTNVTLTSAEVISVGAYLAQIGSEEATAPVPPPVNGTGLVGRYFNNKTLTGTPALTRTEVVNFDWGTNAPGTGIGKDNFSVRWTGDVKTSAAGGYRFRTVSDDGVRLWVNGVLVIDNWSLHGATTNTSNTITLAANTRYTIKMEFYEQTGSAVAKLQWRLPGTSSYVTIPAASLFGN